MGFDMKEYLRKNSNGSYSYIGYVHADHVSDSMIEIPEGDTWAYKNSRGNIITMHGNVCQAFIGDLVWQRESPNDKLASAEQYRQAEVLPFIDDEPDFKKLADLMVETTKHKPTETEWDLSDYDFAESDVEQDNVNNPSHYADSAIECIDAMQAMLTPEQFVGYLRGNILKYQWRYEKKNGIEDLRKSQWYLDKLISVL